jgi:WD40 repeat protein/tRNA A-37 threonylcarbamoyl transferase component Bud32
MNSKPTCQTCGATLTSAASDGVCSACMLRSALVDSNPETTVIMTASIKLPRDFGPYELVTEIARGGMGVVYKARQIALNRTVALKMLISGAYSSESLLRRFQVEAEAAAALQHPNIVAIHEFGECDSQPFYTMDYVEGRNLSEVAGGKPLEPERAARYLRAIALAVHFAHERGILHRDLKPSNVLIDQHDDRPRVTDFGLAKRLHGESDVTLAGQMLGSPNFAPPEQAAGRQAEVGVTSDVYSLGGLLYNLLTGRPPFLASSVQETLRLVFETEPVAPRDLNREVPRDLETICLKCLEKDPARRYESAKSLADELDRFLKGEPILARPVSAPEQAWRWSRRHPAIASLAATVVIALTATSAIFYTSAQRIDRARAQEQVALRAAEDDLYAANMQVASKGFSAVAGFDPRSLRHSLDETRPTAGRRDVRGFEWRHFWYRGQSDALATLKGHLQVVDAAFFSPDGSLLATHSLDGVLKLWDAGTMHELQSLNGVARPGGFTPDGRRLVYSQPDNSIWQLDLLTRQTSHVLAPTGRLIALHPSGNQAVVFGADALPVLRTLGVPGSQERGAEVGLDVCAVISADGRRAAVSSPPGRPYAPGTILVIDLATHQQVAALIDPRPVIALALSPDGTGLVSAGFDGVLKIWDVDGGTLTRSIKGFLDPVWGMAYSADGRSFAAGGNNRTVNIWNTSTWSDAEPEILQGHASTVHCVAFSPDGQRLVSGAEDDLALVWPAQVKRLPKEIPRLLRGPTWGDRTPGLAFSPDSRLFAGTAADGKVKVWRTDTIDCVATFPADARTVAFSPDGKSVLGEGYDGIVQRWKLDGENPEQTIKPKAMFANWQVDPLTSQERVALVADQPETRAQCRLCEISSARDGINAGAMQSTPTIAMSPNGQTMFVGLPQGDVEAWDVAARKRLFVFSAHQLSVTALAVSADGQYLATGSLDNTTKLWEAATGKAIATFYAHNRPVWALAFSPDGQTLAAGSCDKEIVLCSVPLRRHVASLALYVGLPKGYEQEVRLLRFSPDGNILAASLGDGTVRFFRAAPFSQTDTAPSANGEKPPL